MEKLKSKSKKDRRKCKEVANKKPEVSKQSFRSRRLEVIWLRESTRQATETREGRGSSLSPRVSSLRDRSFLRSYIAPILCRLSKTGKYLWPNEMTWLWDQNDTSLPYACAEVLRRTKNCPWSPQSHPHISSTHESSVENVATTARGYGCAHMWCTRRRARIWEAASSSGASFFAGQRRARNASDWWWTARDHGKGTDGGRSVVSFPPPFARTSKERRLGTRQFERPAREWCSPVCGIPLVYTRCRSTVALSLT